MKKILTILISVGLLVVVVYLSYLFYSFLKSGASANLFDLKNIVTVKTGKNSENVSPKSKESIEYENWFQSFATLSGARSTYSKWDYKTIPVRIKINQYNPAKNTLSVNFVDPQIAPRYNQENVEVTLQCNADYISSKSYKDPADRETSAYTVSEISFDEATFKELLAKFSSSTYQAATLFTYCLDENCNSVGNACMFEELPGN